MWRRMLHDLAFGRTVSCCTALNVLGGANEGMLEEKVGTYLSIVRANSEFSDGLE
jgi:hypothetical protein